MGADEPRSAGVTALAAASQKITEGGQDYLVVPEIKGTVRIFGKHPDCTYCALRDKEKLCFTVARRVNCADPEPAHNPARGRVIMIHTDDASIEAYLVARVTEKLNGST